jgi:hypothetical protein
MAVAMPLMPAPMINTAVSAWFLFPIRTSGQGLSPGIVVDTSWIEKSS